MSFLDRVAHQCEAAGIEFTDEHRKFLRELLYVISLQQQLAQRTGEPEVDLLDLLRAWGDRFDRLTADDPAELFDCLGGWWRNLPNASTFARSRRRRSCLITWSGCLSPTGQQKKRRPRLRNGRSGPEPVAPTSRPGTKRTSSGPMTRRSYGLVALPRFSPPSIVPKEPARQGRCRIQSITRLVKPFPTWRRLWTSTFSIGETVDFFLFLHSGLTRSALMKNAHRTYWTSFVRARAPRRPTGLLSSSK
jgi:hypothetical protein